MTGEHRTDAVFKRKYKASHREVVKVAEYLARHGLSVEVQPQILRPDVSVREEYMDDFDIHIKTDDGIKKVDAKGNPTRLFTAENPWPFPSMICQSAYDVNRKGFPWLVFQVNKQLTWAVRMFVPDITSHLFKRNIFNSSTGKMQWCWCVPMEYTTYVNLDK